MISIRNTKKFVKNDNRYFPQIFSKYGINAVQVNEKTKKLAITQSYGYDSFNITDPFNPVLQIMNNYGIQPGYTPSAEGDITSTVAVVNTGQVLVANKNNSAGISVFSPTNYSMQKTADVDSSKIVTTYQGNDLFAYTLNIFNKNLHTINYNGTYSNVTGPRGETVQKTSDVTSFALNQNDLYYNSLSFINGKLLVVSDKAFYLFTPGDFSHPVVVSKDIIGLNSEEEIINVCGAWHPRESKYFIAVESATNTSPRQSTGIHLIYSSDGINFYPALCRSPIFYPFNIPTVESHATIGVDEVLFFFTEKAQGSNAQKVYAFSSRDFGRDITDKNIIFDSVIQTQQISSLAVDNAVLLYSANGFDAAVTDTRYSVARTVIPPVKSLTVPPYTPTSNEDITGLVSNVGIPTDGPIPYNAWYTARVVKCMLMYKCGSAAAGSHYMVESAQQGFTAYQIFAAYDHVLSLHSYNPEDAINYDHNIREMHINWALQGVPVGEFAADTTIADIRAGNFTIPSLEPTTVQDANTWQDPTSDLTALSYSHVAHVNRLNGTTGYIPPIATIVSPSAPVGVLASQNNQGTHVSWIRPANPGATGIREYLVEVFENGARVKTLKTPLTSHTETSLNNYNAYEFRVTAVGNTPPQTITASQDLSGLVSSVGLVTPIAGLITPEVLYAERVLTCMLMYRVGVAGAGSHYKRTSLQQGFSVYQVYATYDRILAKFGYDPEAAINYDHNMREMHINWGLQGRRLSVFYGEFDDIIANDFEIPSLERSTIQDPHTYQDPSADLVALGYSHSAHVARLSGVTVIQPDILGPVAVSNIVAPANAIVPPSQPTNVTLTPNDRGLLATWTQPNNGGAEILAQFIKLISSTSEVVYSVSKDINSYQFSGLTNGTSYTFIVWAVNSAGLGAEGASPSAIPAATLFIPDSPSIYSLTVGSPSSVLVKWTNGANGGLPIKGHKLVAVSSDPNEMRKVYEISSQKMEYTATDLNPTGTYYFLLQNLNDVGYSNPTTSLTINLSSGQTTPGAVKNVVATGGNAKVTLTWEKPDVENSLTGYSIRLYGNSSIIAAVSSTTLTYVVENLVNDTEYQYEVAAKNAAGNGAFVASNKVTPHSTTSVTPSAPISPLAVAGDAYADLTWLLPNSDGGSRITGYKIEVINSNSVLATYNIEPVLAHRVRGLINGKEYIFKIYAINSNGASVAATTNAVTPVAIVNFPNKVNNLIVATSNNRAIVSWTAPDQTFGIPQVNSYIISLYKEDISKPSIMFECTDLVNLTYTIMGLLTDVWYYVGIRAKNINGTSVETLSREFKATDAQHTTTTKVVENNKNYKVFYKAPVDLNTLEYIYQDTEKTYLNAYIISKDVTFPVVLNNISNILFFLVNGFSQTVSLESRTYSQLELVEALNIAFNAKALPLEASLSGAQIAVRHKEKGEEKTLGLLSSGVYNINDIIFGSSPTVSLPVISTGVTNHIPTYDYDRKHKRALIESRPIGNAQSFVVNDKIKLLNGKYTLSLPHANLLTKRVALSWLNEDGSKTNVVDYVGDGKLKLRTYLYDVNGNTKIEYRPTLIKDGKDYIGLVNYQLGIVDELSFPNMRAASIVGKNVSFPIRFPVNMPLSLCLKVNGEEKKYILTFTKADAYGIEEIISLINSNSNFISDGLYATNALGQICIKNAGYTVDINNKLIPNMNPLKTIEDSSVQQEFNIFHQLFGKLPVFIKAPKVYASYAYTTSVSDPTQHIWYQTPHFIVSVKNDVDEAFTRAHINYINSRLDVLKPVTAVMDGITVSQENNKENLIFTEQVQCNILTNVYPPFLMVTNNPPGLVGSTPDITVTNPDEQLITVHNMIFYE